MLSTPVGDHGGIACAAGSFCFCLFFAACPISMYCIFGYGKITDIGTFSFRWILPFWYFCFLLAHKARIFQRPRGTLVNCQTRAHATRARDDAWRKHVCWNLRKPARAHRADAIQRFCRGQKYSTKFSTKFSMHTAVPEVPGYVYGRTSRLVLKYRPCVHTAVPS